MRKIDKNIIKRIEQKSEEILSMAILLYVKRGRLAGNALAQIEAAIAELKKIKPFPRGKK